MTQNFAKFHRNDRCIYNIFDKIKLNIHDKNNKKFNNLNIVYLDKCVAEVQELLNPKTN